MYLCIFKLKEVNIKMTIREERLKRGWTQLDLLFEMRKADEKFKGSQKEISAWERGIYEPSRKAIVVLNKVFGTQGVLY